MLTKKRNKQVTKFKNSKLNLMERQ